MSKESAQRQSAARLAESVGIDLRLILRDMQQRITDFEMYIDSWEGSLAEEKADGDPRIFTGEDVVIRALATVDELVHMPTGGTGYMHVRNLRTRLVQLAKLSS